MNKKFVVHARVLKAMSDENRLRILDLLREREYNASELLDEMDFGQSTLSHHMRILLQAGAVKARKNGKWTYYSLNKEIFSTVAVDKETIAGAVILLIDVTEKMQRDSLRREFTANVSHELKTPLTSISGFAEIIQSGFVKQEDVRKFAGKIFDETQRLVTLVDDIIKISQLDENCQPYQREKVDIYNLAKDVLSRLQESANKAQVQLNMEGEHAELETVLPILDEIVSNLCDNAIKYNKKGGSVTVTVLNTRNQICLSVRDTGIGITAAEKSRVFERFYRVDKSHSKEIGGTGLGLSIVKHGAAYLGAKVELESTIDKGSTFRLIWQK